MEGCPSDTSTSPSLFDDGAVCADVAIGAGLSEARGIEPVCAVPALVNDASRLGVVVLRGDCGWTEVVAIPGLLVVDRLIQETPQSCSPMAHGVVFCLTRLERSEVSVKTVLMPTGEVSVQGRGRNTSTPSDVYVAVPVLLTNE